MRVKPWGRKNTERGTNSVEKSTKNGFFLRNTCQNRVP